MNSLVANVVWTVLIAGALPKRNRSSDVGLSNLGDGVRHLEAGLAFQHQAPTGEGPLKSGTILQGQTGALREDSALNPRAAADDDCLISLMQEG